MRTEMNQNLRPMPHPSRTLELQPTDRIGDWAEPNQDPILDATRMPFEAFRTNKPPHRAIGMYIWLQLLRPAVLILFWIGVGYYAWRHLFQSADQLRSTGLLIIYAGVIGVIFAAMLLMAPFRRYAHRDSQRAKPAQASSMAELASYANVPSKDLSGWQQAQRLVVHHDDEGRLSDAFDMGDREDPVLPQRRRPA